MPAILYLVVATAVVVMVARWSRLSATAAVALVLAPLLVTGGALLGGRVFAPVALAYINGPLAPIAEQVGVRTVANPTASDVFAQFLPWHEAVRDAIVHHQWPLWDRFASSGTILAGAVQAAPYHPVHLLALLLPLPSAVTFIATMLFFTAALAMFIFLRPIVSSEAAALFGAIAWMFCDYVVGFAGTSHGMSVAEVPLLLSAARGIAAKASLRAISLLTAALVLLVVTGHPETLLHGVALATAWFVLELAIRRFASWKKSIVAGVTAGAAALLLTAVVLLPLLDAIPQTDEYRYRVNPFEAGPARIDRVVHHVAAELFPFMEGTAGREIAHHTAAVRHPWSGAAYGGTLLFALAAFGLARNRDAYQRFLAVLAVFGLLAGASTPFVLAAIRAVPGFSLAVNERMIWFAALAFAVLAARGLDEWLTERRDRDPLVAVCCFAAAAVFATVLWFLYPQIAESGLSGAYIRVAAMRAVIPLLLAAATVLAVRPRRLAIGMIVGLLLVSRAADTETARASVPGRAFYPPFAGLSLISRPAPFRIVGQGPLLTPNTAAHYGLEDVRGYQAMTLGRYADTYPLWSIRQHVWSNRVDDLGAPLLSMMNVRYALANPGVPQPPWWIRRGSFVGYDVLENERALPRAYVPARVHVVRSAQDAHSGMAGCTDFRLDAWVESAQQPHSIANGAGSVTVRGSGSQFDLHATMQQDGWVIVSEPAWKGWRAIESGRGIPIHFANEAFLGIHLPAGSHHVKLVYRPTAFVAGGAISGASALAALLIPLVRRRRRR